MKYPTFFAPFRALMTAVIICLFVETSKCQEATPLGPAYMRTTSGVVETSSGRCQCETAFPPLVTCQDYVETGYPERLEAAEREIALLGHQLEEYNHTVIRLHIDLELADSQLNVTMMTLEGVLDGTVVVTVAELELVKEELKEMSLLLERIEEVASEIPEVQQLREELNNFTELIKQLEVTRPTEVRVLQRKIDDLKSKLAECERYTRTEDESLFQPWSDFPSQDSCRDIIHVSEPFTVRGVGNKIGAWFRDPLQDYIKVYYAPFHNPRLTYQVDRFAHVADFRGGTEYEHRYMLPTNLPAQGPGMVAYNGSLYYHAFQSRQIVRYDLENHTVVTTGEISDADINIRGSPSAIDLAVDELGLWAIYASVSDQTNTMISRLDPETLDVIETWVAPFPKYQAGSCFMVCGRLYCLSSFFSTDSTVELVYETSSNVFRVIDVLFDIRFGEMMSLKYNPRDQKLYGWDNGHQVVYDLTFDPPARSQLLPTDTNIPLNLQ
ncbi:amassin precursor [Strongylocentrotus purpuratus]|uniref:Amassin n=1 Tax=Strongylocentrotus purpuratus TaxID=7668 RepID=Q86RA9_STRPU|nr:amassin precursor [Strongylocentrotus purpuratus]AAO43562.1 amassin [Strongylocentrotus purpuratus]